MRSSCVKNGLILGIIFLFICMSFTPSVAIDTVKKPFMSISIVNTLYVGGSGEGNYTSIQDAIDNASDEDTVYVFGVSSPYNETIVLDKTINLIGENRDTTVIDGYRRGTVVYVSNDWVNISGFTIRNSSNYRYGICLDSSSSNTIWDNTISDNVIGIYQFDSNNNTILDNNISSNEFWGIGLDIGTIYNTISGNKISGNGIGVHLHHSYRNIITGNYIVSNKNYGISLHFLCNKTIISNNNYALHSYSYGDNTIYNNYFNNTINAEDDGNNIWNINKTLGTNIIGGQWLGGNYWSDYSGDDLDGDGLGDTKLPYNRNIKNGGDWLPLKNQPPEITVINGSKSGRSGRNYSYAFVAEDPNGDDVRYFIDWGDNNTEWTGFSISGKNINVKHTWGYKGTFNISARAQDIYGAGGPEGTLTINMPKNKPFIFNFNLRGWLFELFPLMERLIGLFR